MRVQPPAKRSQLVCDRGTSPSAADQVLGGLGKADPSQCTVLDVGQRTSVRWQTRRRQLDAASRRTAERNPNRHANDQLRQLLRRLPPSPTGGPPGTARAARQRRAALYWPTRKQSTATTPRRPHRMRRPRRRARALFLAMLPVMHPARECCSRASNYPAQSLHDPNWARGCASRRLGRRACSSRRKRRHARRTTRRWCRWC